MSVSRTGKAEEYRDLEVQHVFTEFIIDPADLPTNQVFATATKKMGPVANDLHRTEKAELVQYEMKQANVWFAAGTTQDGEAQIFWELSLDGSPSMAIQDEDLSKVPNEDDIGSENSISYWNGVSDKTDIIWTGEFIHESGAYDTAGGAGKGPSQGNSATPFKRNYRDDFGGGPTVDARDDVYEHVAMTANNVDSAEMFVNIYYTLYWDVWDEG